MTYTHSAMTDEQYESILRKLNEQEVVLCMLKQQLTDTKDVLTFAEVVVYTGYKESYLYKLTSKNLIPHYKPEGKMIFFDRTELIAWLKRNPRKTLKEIDENVEKYIQYSNNKKVANMKNNCAKR